DEDRARAASRISRARAAEAAIRRRRVADDLCRRSFPACRLYSLWWRSPWLRAGDRLWAARCGRTAASDIPCPRSGRGLSILPDGPRDSCRGEMLVVRTQSWRVEDIARD